MNDSIFRPRGESAANRVACDMAERRRIRNARFLVVKSIGGEEKIMGHALKRPAAERQALAVGGHVVERS